VTGCLKFDFDLFSANECYFLENDGLPGTTTPSLIDVQVTGQPDPPRGSALLENGSMA
jgi:hypothetical protein